MGENEEWTAKNSILNNIPGLRSSARLNTEKYLAILKLAKVISRIIYFPHYTLRTKFVLANRCKKKYITIIGDFTLDILFILHFIYFTIYLFKCFVLYIIYLLSIKNFKALVPLRLGVTNKQIFILQILTILDHTISFIRLFTCISLFLPT